MPLLNCPDCGQYISDAAPACIHCGRPMITRPGAPVTPRAPEAGRSSPTCQKCGSTALRALSVLYASSTGKATAKTTAVGVGGDGLVVADASTTTSTATGLTNRVAPPQPKTVDSSFSIPGCLVQLLGFGTCFGMAQGEDGAGMGMFLFLVASVVGFGISHAVNSANREEAERWNRVDLPRLRKEWNESVMCLTCNHIQALPGK